MQALQKFEITLDKYVSPVFNQPLVVLLVSYLVIVQIVLATPKIPSTLQTIIDHPITRTIVTFGAFYSFTKQVHLSLLFTAAVMVTYFLVMKKEPFDLVWPQTNTSPNCGNVTLSDLLSLFNGDRDKLKETMLVSGVPLNIQLSEANAPLIATYLINFGHQVSDSCKMP